MNLTRSELLQRLEYQCDPWDIIVIGGGATGLGAALDAVSRGYRTVLLEQGDFASGTSSRSTKLIHGGVRYLQQGNLPLVYEALKERQILLSNAPHLVHELPFVLPLYRWWQRPFYGAGLALYDMLSGVRRLHGTKHLDIKETVERIPGVRRQNLRGGFVYYDCQFDDARMAISLARTVIDLGGTALNYVKVCSISAVAGSLTKVTAIDQENGREYALTGRAVINATGVWSDQVRKMDDPSSPPLITLSQGAHLVLDRSFLPSDNAIMIPVTDDGRVFFAIPWNEHVIIGTTDIPVLNVTPEPAPTAEEVDFLLAHAGRCLERQPLRSDVLSSFAGLRPLTGSNSGVNTAKMSRKFLLSVSDSGLVTITGGKWTTYRSMAAAAVDAAARQGKLDVRHSCTRSLRLHGWELSSSPAGSMSVYGSDRLPLEQLSCEQPGWKERLHPRIPYTAGEIVWAVRFEWARSVEDVLARRTRALFLDAGACREIAPLVARLLASELGYDQAWQTRQLELFDAVSGKYLIN